MTTCAGCGEQIGDDDWACGSCGAPVAKSAPAADPYGYEDTSYAAPAPAAARGGLSGTTLAVLVVAAVAVVAIIGVWFFLLRGGGGAQFIGTWTATDGSAGGLVIVKNGSDFEISILGADQQRVGPLKGELHGDELEIRLESAGGDDAEQAAVAVVKAMFEALVEDFELLLTHRSSDDRLLLDVAGEPVAGMQPVPTTEYVRATTP